MSADKEKFVVSKLQGEDYSAVSSIRLPVKIKEKIEEIIKRTGRSRNQIIVMALDYALDRVELDENDETKEH